MGAFPRRHSLRAAVDWSMRSQARIWFRVGGIPLLLYGGLLAMLAAFQDRMIYFPSHRTEPLALREAAMAGFDPWRARDGRLIGWRSPPPCGDHRLIVFHGNAGMASQREYFRDGMRGVGGVRWDVFVLEYPGYGSRPGKPGENAFFAAGREALQELRREDDRPIFLLGESIGSGVAARLAGEARERINGLVLITPFTCLTDVAAHHYPWLPVRWLLRDRFDNEAALRGFHGSLAVVLAERDEVVPAELGQRLYDSYPGRKRLWLHSGAGHNTLDTRPQAAWWGELSEFLLARSVRD